MTAIEGIWRRAWPRRLLVAFLGGGGMAWLLLLWAIPAAASQLAPGTRDAAALRLSASWRVRIEEWGWFATDLADTRYAFVGSLLRVGLGQTRGRWSWRIEGAQPLLIGLPKSATAPPPQGQSGLGAAYRAANDEQFTSVFVKQAFLGLRLDERGTITARLGRFEFGEGAEAAPRDPTLGMLKRERIAERLVGSFGFTHVGRSFDGVHLVRDDPELHLSVMAGRATAGVFRLDAMGWARTDVAYAAVTRPGRASTRDGTGPRADLRFFALGYRDARGLPKVDNRPGAIRSADAEEIRILTLGGHYLASWALGGATVDLVLWVAAQAGDWGTLRHRAAAFVGEVGLQPNSEAVKPWIRAGAAYGTGDGDPADGNHGTFFQVLPTPRLYARFPFYNMMNTQDAYVQVTLRPGTRWILRAEAHHLRAANGADLWYSGGGAFESRSFGFAGRPTDGKRGLATLLDLSVDYRASAKASFGFYVSRAFGGDAIRSIYPSGPDAWFAYTEMRWQF